jgi:hypothetical protein
MLLQRAVENPLHPCLSILLCDRNDKVGLGDLGLAQCPLVPDSCIHEASSEKSITNSFVVLLNDTTIPSLMHNHHIQLNIILSAVNQYEVCDHSLE